MAAKPIGHRVILSQRASIIDPRSTVPYRAIALGTTPSYWKNFLPSQKTSLFLTDAIERYPFQSHLKFQCFSGVWLPPSFTELSLCILLACIYSNKCSVTALYVIRFSLSIVFTDLLFCVSCFVCDLLYANPRQKRQLFINFSQFFWAHIEVCPNVRYS